MRTTQIRPDLRLGLSLLLVISLEVSPGTSISPLLKKQHFQIPLRPRMWSSKSLDIIHFIHKFSNANLTIKDIETKNELRLRERNKKESS